MNLNELRAAGGFIESALVRKEITWTRVPAGRKKAVSDTFQVFVRRNSFGAVERLFSAEGDQQSRNARYLAECIRLGETGEESLTYEQPTTSTRRWASCCCRRSVRSTGSRTRKN